ncbi:MAG: protein arginine kinase [Ruminiclostridium sp.]|nr:protein arginine kinase [Ruminiclostridium sp.]
MAEENNIESREAQIAISSRVRLARNIDGIPFPTRMNAGQDETIINRVWESISQSSEAVSKNLVLMKIGRLDPIDRQILVEKHIISPDLGESKRESAVIISRDEKISIMINEEDHLRIQCIFPGMQLDDAWQLCNKLDVLLEEKIDFAFDKKLGYLTCCPTNVGTGIRASVMLHLPALGMTGYIRNILEAGGKIGIAIRGIYGENSEASGNMFQISNQVTLGQTEEEIIANVKNVASQIIEQEKLLRRELYNQNPYRFEDRIYRSLGLLSNARIMTAEESLKLLSDVRLGVDMGTIGGINMETLNEMMLVTQPAYIQRLAGKTLSPDERDIRRAELIRSSLRND